MAIRAFRTVSRNRNQKQNGAAKVDEIGTLDAMAQVKEQRTYIVPEYAVS